MCVEGVLHKSLYFNEYCNILQMIDMTSISNCNMFVCFFSDEKQFVPFFLGRYRDYFFVIENISLKMFRKWMAHRDFLLYK